MSSNSQKLEWPVGYPRTAATERKRATFGTTSRREGNSYSTKSALTVAQAVDRLQQELKSFTRPGRTWRTECLEISTNMPTRQDGMPYSGAREPEDPGVAVYFHLDHKPTVFCCDKWDRVADNLAAIAATIGALRGIERWGVTEADRAFTGFAALPEKASARSCWDILNVSREAPAEEIVKAWRAALKKAHPDHGGSTEAFDEVQTAWTHAQQEREELKA